MEWNQLVSRIEGCGWKASPVKEQRKRWRNANLRHGNSPMNEAVQTDILLQVLFVVYLDKITNKKGIR